MLYKYHLNNKNLEPLNEVSFASLKILERRDIESWIEKQPEIVGEELIIITSEYDRFDKTDERLDLMAIDKNGKLVILELKRDDSGNSVELQSIKYAAYCSNLTFSEIINLREEYLLKKGIIKKSDEVEDEIINFIENESFEELDDKPRIILISKEFRPEVTASVLWLRNFQLDITCIKLTPYKINENEIGISINKIIPLPEAEDFQIQAVIKESGEGGLTRSQKEYYKFWEELKGKLENKLGIRLIRSSKNSYYTISIGIGGIHLEYVFSGKPRNSFNIELHFELNNRNENLKNLNSLKEYFPELESLLGEKIEIYENWGTNWSKISLQRKIEALDEDLKKFAIDKMEIMYNYLKPKIEKIKK